jgi:hypothetical protein
MEQSGLPAWLESLRAGERSAAPMNNASSFSTADFIDEDSLPSWMRAERNDARDNTGANFPVSARPPLPDLGIDGNYPPATGIPAQSLLDEQALPPWMREGAQSATTPGNAQERISASSLVQSDNMPDWMKSLQGNQGSAPSDMRSNAVNPFAQSSQPIKSQIPPTPQIPMTPQQNPNASLSGFSARDLIDPQALPSWMVQQGGQNAMPRSERNQASSPHIPVPSQLSNQVPPPSARPGQQGFSARDLIDPQALPSWMVQQGGRAGQQAQSTSGEHARPPEQQGQPPAGQTFSAASLLDVNSLPSWLRENGQRGQEQGAPGPLASQAFLPPSSGSSSAASGGHIPASSFLDVSALPEWMRQANAQQPNNGFNAPSQPQYGQTMSQAPGSLPPNIYAGPPKVENIRVPNRPRNEVNPNENSEVAANVFASMLGVASSAPSYPAPSSQPPSSYQQSGAQGNLAQPNMGGYPMNQMNQPGMPSSGSGSYMGSGVHMGAMPNTPGMTGNAQQGYNPTNNYGGNYQNGMNNSPMGNSPSANASYTSNTGTSASGQRAADMADEQKNTKKRGLFGAILEWLTR